MGQIQTIHIPYKPCRQYGYMIILFRQLVIGFKNIFVNLLSQGVLYPDKVQKCSCSVGEMLYHYLFHNDVCRLDILLSKSK